MDDGRSSSLSEIDELSDNEPSDFEDSIKPERQLENDSEAETERIEDSPHNIRKRGDIVLSAGSAGPSPSKLHQSTTLADVDDEEQLVDDSPSKPRLSHNNGLTDNIPDLDDMDLPDSTGKKRKRVEAGDDTGTELGDEEPIKKRRSSIKSDLSDPIDDDMPLSPEPIEDPITTNDDELPADDVPESDLPAPPVKGKRGKRGKRRGRRALDADEETEGGDVVTEDVADENLGEEEEPAEREEANDAETAAKLEEECKSQIAA
jgi:hypothetical protein